MFTAPHPAVTAALHFSHSRSGQDAHTELFLVIARGRPRHFLVPARRLMLTWRRHELAWPVVLRLWPVPASGWPRRTPQSSTRPAIGRHIARGQCLLERTVR